MANEQEQSSAPHVWYLLLTLAFFICLVIPLVLLLTLAYQEQASSSWRPSGAPVPIPSPSIVTPSAKVPAPPAGPLQSVATQPQKTNTPPRASLVATQDETDVLTWKLDASACRDKEDTPDVLQVRWRFAGAGEWDTGYAGDKKISRRFATPGTYQVTIEVKDSGELTDQTRATVQIQVPLIRRSSHKDVKNNRCFECHYPLANKPSCRYGEEDGECLRCHEWQK